METEFLVETLSSNGLCLVNIDDLPSLVSTVVLVIINASDNNSLTFFILSVSNFEDLVIGWIDESFTLELEYLEPS
jgi:hypothetical protein